MSTRRQPAPLRQLVELFLKQADADVSDRAAPARLAPEFIRWLRSMAEGGDALARAALDRMQVERAEQWLKDGLARRIGWQDPETGQPLAGRTRAGTPIRDEHGARVGGFQQVLFRRMTRREFEDWTAGLRANRAALAASITFADRVLRAWDRYPTASSLEEVCDLAGIELPPELRGEATA